MSKRMIVALEGQYILPTFIVQPGAIVWTEGAAIPIIWESNADMSMGIARNPQRDDKGVITVEVDDDFELVAGEGLGVDYIRFARDVSYSEEGVMVVPTAVLDSISIFHNLPWADADWVPGASS